MVHVVALDHVVLNVADTTRSIAWYRDELGLEVLRYDEWERGEVFFPSVRIDPETIMDVLQTDRTGQNVDHICLVVTDDIDALASSGRFEIVDGPDVRWGARGDARAVYVRDPDGNVIELRNYGS